MDDKLTEALRLLGHCKGALESVVLGRLPDADPGSDFEAQWNQNRDNLVARIDKLTEEATSDG